MAVLSGNKQIVEHLKISFTMPNPSPIKVIVVCVMLLSNMPFLKNAAAQSFYPEQHESGVMVVKPAIPIRAYPFDLADVRLLNSPFKEAMEADLKYLLELSPDRFLAHFRTHAGLPAKDSAYGGWESEGLAGHSLGHYLSACSMAYAATGDTALLHRVQYIVSELALCQEKRGTGYVGAIPNEDSIFGKISRGIIESRGFDLNGGWSPWYTVHKIMAGLLDAYMYCHIPQALEVEKGMADWTERTVKNLSDAQMQQMLICEYGGMNEVLANTYAVTGNPKYLKLAYRFYDHRILDSLAMQKDILPGKHSNTQIPKIIGCARIYELTGDRHMDSIATFFWNDVVYHHTYAPGGNGNYEYFGMPDTFPLSDNTMETCPTYNMLKLTTHLFSWHPSAKFMDYYERALYNHILATQNHQTGMMCYFTPLRMGSRKTYSTPFNSFWCCVGTGMENHVKYGQDIYDRGADGSLYVNLFIPSVLHWKQRQIIVTQKTNLPRTDTVYISLQMKQPQAFSIRIRKPLWAHQGMMVYVNGEKVPAQVDQDGYMVIHKTWRNGDRINCIIPEDLYTIAMPHDSSRIAIFYGPVLLAGDFGHQEPDPAQGVPVFVTSDRNVAHWIQRDGDRLIFHTIHTGQPADVKLIPFYETNDLYYSVYWDMFTPEQWAMRQQEYEAEKRRQEELEKRTVDVLRMGEMQPERDHQFKGEKTFTWEAHRRNWRAAGQDGYFSFIMKVDIAHANQLICTYWGGDNRGRKFDILVDGERIATEDLNRYHESRFYSIIYPIPESLIHGKQEITITFQPQPGQMAGPVCEVRVVREK